MTSHQNQNPGAVDWQGARGAKWQAQAAGMEAMLAPVDRPLIRALRLETSMRIAEVGCGGGATTLAIHAAAPRGSLVHGFDIAPGLVELARRRVQPDTSRLAFEVADMATASPAAPYERLVSRFGVMFFDAPDAAFVNLARWLVPGGRFAFAVWGRQADNPWFATVRQVVAEVAPLPKADPDAPGPFRYAEADTLTALLTAAGFTDITVDDWSEPLAIGGGLAPEGAAAFALAAFSSFAEVLSEAGDRAFAVARRILSERFSDHAPDGVVRLGARVHIVAGRT